jgi:hypothetical protein
VLAELTSLYVTADLTLPLHVRSRELAAIQQVIGRADQAKASVRSFFSTLG